jgi:uncharacterized protein (DUF2236 family)
MAIAPAPAPTDDDAAARGARRPAVGRRARPTRRPAEKHGLLGLLRRADPKRLEPMEDYGWFGPDSVTWRVWAYPTSVTVGFSRSVVVEELDPFLIAPVKVSSKIYQQGRVRYDRTLRYFATYLFADSRTVAKATEMLMRIHARVAAPDPVTGLVSDPNNPDQQLWIHLTAWHSILYCYERFGPGPLSPEDEARYWADCATAAKAQTIDPATVPRSRAEVREYFDRMRPRMAASEATQEAMDHLMRAEVIYPELPLVVKPPLAIFARLLRAAVISTLPRYQRELGNLRQPRIVDALIGPVMRAHFKLLARSPRLQLRLLGVLSPSTVPIAGPALVGLPPRTDEVVTPEETFRRHEAPTPAELYAELRHDQDRIVFRPSAPVPAEVAARAAVDRHAR